MRAEGPSDITRIILFVLVIGTLLLASLWTLLPFLSGMIWATTITVATWPLLLRLESATGGRRALAVAVMTLLVLLVFIVPFALAISTMLDAAGRSPTVMNAFLTKGLGPPPAWIDDIPVVGSQMAAEWQAVSAGGPEALAAVLQPYGRSAAAWAIAATGGVGRMVVLILLTVVLVAILYADGETAARGVLAFAHRLGGETAERTVRLAGQAVRSVALGVVLTALVHAVLLRHDDVLAPAVEGGGDRLGAGLGHQHRRGVVDAAHGHDVVVGHRRGHRDPHLPINLGAGRAGGNRRRPRGLGRHRGIATGDEKWKAQRAHGKRGSGHWGSPHKVVTDRSARPG